MGTRNNTQLTLSDLPDEILLKIAQYSSPWIFYHLIYFSRRLSSLRFFKEYKLSTEPVRQLLSHGVLGELEQAQNLWMEYPDLLTFHGTIYHPNRCYKDARGQPLETPIDIPLHQNPGREKYVGCTFWQILFMNEEYEEAIAAGKFMTLEEKQRQFAEIFPDGEIKKYNWDLEEAKKLLQIVFDAVIADDSLQWNAQAHSFAMSENTRQKLHALYQYAKPNSEHTIGLVCDANLYLAAQLMYDKDNEKFKHKWHKFSFWCVCVEEWLAACLGTGYLRAHAQGIGLRTPRRGCVLVNDTSYFAFRRISPDYPGSSFFVGNQTIGKAEAPGRGVGGWPVALSFQKLISDKNAVLERLCASICVQQCKPG